VNRYVFDTDMLTLYVEGHPKVADRVAAHPPRELATTVISVEEQLSGWFTMVRRAKGRAALAQIYRRLAETVAFLGQVPIISFTEAAMDRFDTLRGMKLNIGSMDLRIAAIVVEEGAILVTRNARDFRRVPGLAIEDWSA
jgi:tRNA(fMet)-specific endonuclease VapC